MKISSTNKTEYYKISTFIFLYFFTWSASIGLLAIWLGQKSEPERFGDWYGICG